MILLPVPLEVRRQAIHHIGIITVGFADKNENIKVARNVAAFSLGLPYRVSSNSVGDASPDFSTKFCPTMDSLFLAPIGHFP